MLITLRENSCPFCLENVYALGTELVDVSLQADAHNVIVLECGHLMHYTCRQSFGPYNARIIQCFMCNVDRSILLQRPVRVRSAYEINYENAPGALASVFALSTFSIIHWACPENKLSNTQCIISTTPAKMNLETLVALAASASMGYLGHKMGKTEKIRACIATVLTGFQG